jgi:glycosyltransferase involved in cell wall biosynthesis
VARVFWWGDAGASTGFARGTHAIGDRLVEQYGHEVTTLAVNYRGDYSPTKMRLYRPNTIVGTDTYGQSRVIEMLGRAEPDVVIILNDPYAILRFLFDNRYDTDRILLGYRPIIAYLPVDGTNQPPSWFELLSKVTNPVAMSKWGQRAIPGAKLVYHGVDTDLFWPVSADRPITTSVGNVVTSKAECKQAFGYSPDSFLVLRIDSNSGRKDYPRSWKALLPVMHRHKDIIVHFHCAALDPQSGIDMRAMFSRDEATRERFFLPDNFNTFDGWSQEDMNALYNAADLFVSTSRGEGFGLTLAEAAACGVPIIAQNVSAIPEVVGPGGVLLEPKGLITVPSGQDLWLANVPAFTKAIESLYLNDGKRRALGDAGRAHVEATFSWDFAAARFNEYVEALAASTTGTLSSQ